MANTKLTGLGELIGPPADNDMVYIVDVSDLIMAASGTSKKNQAKNYLRTNGTANTLGANIAANGYNFTGAGTITATGRVGIGTSSPGATLSVVGNSGNLFWVGGSSASARGVSVGNTNITGTEFIALVEGNDVSGLTPFFIQRYNSSHASAANAVEVYQAQNADIRFFTNSSQRMTITGGGNIGIGVSSPAAILDVGNRAMFRSGPSGTGGIWFADAFGTQRTFIGMSDDDATPILGLWNGDWRLQIDSTGNVGIKTNPSSYTLDVNGSFQCTQAGSGWTSLSFNTGWTDFGSGHITGRYKKVGDLVFLSGLVKRTSGGATTIATLPLGFRPGGIYLYIMNTDSGAGRIDIDTSGNIVLQSGGVAWVQLNGLVFSTL